jgi:peptidoglycan/xylan/chitin deacetylase (PgdA/CDA1 family)
METLKDAIRQTLFHAGVPAVMRLGRRLRGEHRATILMYHKVSVQSAPLFGRSVRPDVFERQIRALKRAYRVVDLLELADSDGLRHVGQEVVVVTFDDGYRSNYTEAFPILKAYGVPATIFLATDYMDTQRILPHDQLAGILYRSARIPAPRDLQGEGFSSEIVDMVMKFFHSDTGKLRSLFSLEGRFKAMPVVERDLALERLARVCDVPSWREGSDRVMLSWDEVREMSKQGISFGSHTRSHPVLSLLSLSEIRTEIAESRERIESEIQKPITTFAYPYGKPEDYPKEMTGLLRQEGYRLACNTTMGAERLPILSPFDLKRRGGPLAPYLFL